MRARSPSGGSGSARRGRKSGRWAFDERFKRLWEFYLHYCEAGFRAGNIDVRQMVYVKAP